MLRKCSLVEGEIYHIYNRGTDKRIIFQDIFDYRRFVKLLFFCNSYKPLDYRSISKCNSFGKFIEKRGTTLVDIGAYCLMPNHFHLLIRKKEPQSVSIFMKKLSTAYSMYFNAKNSRTGKLFESVFKNSHANSDQYLKYLFAYIHLNPLKLLQPDWKENGIRDRELATNYLRNYEFSSHTDYSGTDRETSLILNKLSFPEYFGNELDLQDYDKFISDWMFAEESPLHTEESP